MFKKISVFCILLVSCFTFLFACGNPYKKMGLRVSYSRDVIELYIPSQDTSDNSTLSITATVTGVKKKLNVTTNFEMAPGSDNGIVSIEQGATRNNVTTAQITAQKIGRGYLNIKTAEGGKSTRIEVRVYKRVESVNFKKSQIPVKEKGSINLRDNLEFNAGTNQTDVNYKFVREVEGQKTYVDFDTMMSMLPQELHNTLSFANETLTTNFNKDVREYENSAFSEFIYQADGYYNLRMVAVSCVNGQENPNIMTQELNLPIIHVVDEQDITLMENTGSGNVVLKELAQNTYQIVLATRDYEGIAKNIAGTRRITLSGLDVNKYKVSPTLSNGQKNSTLANVQDYTTTDNFVYEVNGGSVAGNETVTFTIDYIGFEGEFTITKQLNLVVENLPDNIYVNDERNPITESSPTDDLRVFPIFDQYSGTTGERLTIIGGAAGSEFTYNLEVEDNNNYTYEGYDFYRDIVSKIRFNYNNLGEEIGYTQTDSGYKINGDFNNGSYFLVSHNIAEDVLMRNPKVRLKITFTFDIKPQVIDTLDANKYQTYTEVRYIELDFKRGVTYLNVPSQINLQISQSANFLTIPNMDLSADGGFIREITGVDANLFTLDTSDAAEGTIRIVANNQGLTGRSTVTIRTNNNIVAMVDVNVYAPLVFATDGNNKIMQLTLTDNQNVVLDSSSSTYATSYDLGDGQLNIEALNTVYLQSGINDVNSTRIRITNFFNRGDSLASVNYTSEDYVRFAFLSSNLQIRYNEQDQSFGFITTSATTSPIVVSVIISGYDNEGNPLQITQTFTVYILAKITDKNISLTQNVNLYEFNTVGYYSNRYTQSIVPSFTVSGYGEVGVTYTLVQAENTPILNFDLANINTELEKDTYMMTITLGNLLHLVREDNNLTLTANLILDESQLDTIALHNITQEQLTNYVTTLLQQSSSRISAQISTRFTQKRNEIVKTISVNILFAEKVEDIIINVPEYATTGIYFDTRTVNNDKSFTFSVLKDSAFNKNIVPVIYSAVLNDQNIIVPGEPITNVDDQIFTIPSNLLNADGALISNTISVKPKNIAGQQFIVLFAQDDFMSTSAPDLAKATKAYIRVKVADGLTETTAFEIHNYQEFEGIQQDINSGNVYYYNLVRDIALNQRFTGFKGEFKGFINGQFDGSIKTITGYMSTSNQFGIFDTVSGEIKNVGIKDAQIRYSQAQSYQIDNLQSATPVKSLLNDTLKLNVKAGDRLYILAGSDWQFSSNNSKQLTVNADDQLEDITLISSQTGSLLELYVVTGETDVQGGILVNHLLANGNLSNISVNGTINIVAFDDITVGGLVGLTDVDSQINTYANDNAQINVGIIINTDDAITTSRYIGGVAGQSNSNLGVASSSGDAGNKLQVSTSIFINDVTSDSVYGKADVGGIMGSQGSSDTSTTINNVVVRPNIYSDGRVGGVAGLAINATFNSNAVQFTTATDTKNALISATYVGGIIGEGQDITIRYSYARSFYKDQNSIQLIENKYTGYAGGLVGYLKYDYTQTSKYGMFYNIITNSYSDLNIYAKSLNSQDIYVAGLVGSISDYLHIERLQIRNSYAIGKISYEGLNEVTSKIQTGNFVTGQTEYVDIENLEDSIEIVEDTTAMAPEATAWHAVFKGLYVQGSVLNIEVTYNNREDTDETKRQELTVEIGEDGVLYQRQDGVRGDKLEVNESTDIVQQRSALYTVTADDIASDSITVNNSFDTSISYNLSLQVLRTVSQKATALQDKAVQDGGAKYYRLSDIIGITPEEIADYFMHFDSIDTDLSNEATSLYLLQDGKYTLISSQIYIEEGTNVTEVDETDGLIIAISLDKLADIYVGINDESQIDNIDLGFMLLRGFEQLSATTQGTDYVVELKENKILEGDQLVFMLGDRKEASTDANITNSYFSLSYNGAETNTLYVDMDMVFEDDDETIQDQYMNSSSDLSGILSYQSYLDSEGNPRVKSGDFAYDEHVNGGLPILYLEYPTYSRETEQGDMVMYSYVPTSIEAAVIDPAGRDSHYVYVDSKTAIAYLYKAASSDASRYEDVINKLNTYYVVQNDQTHEYQIINYSAVTEGAYKGIPVESGVVINSSSINVIAVDTIDGYYTLRALTQGSSVITISSDIDSSVSTTITIYVEYGINNFDIIDSALNQTAVGEQKQTQLYIETPHKFELKVDNYVIDSNIGVDCLVNTSIDYLIQSANGGAGFKFNDQLFESNDNPVYITSNVLDITTVNSGVFDITITPRINIQGLDSPVLLQDLAKTFTINSAPKAKYIHTNGTYGAQIDNMGRIIVPLTFMSYSINEQILMHIKDNAGAFIAAYHLAMDGGQYVLNKTNAQSDNIEITSNNIIDLLKIEIDSQQIVPDEKSNGQEVTINLLMMFDYDTYINSTFSQSLNRATYQLSNLNYSIEFIPESNLDISAQYQLDIIQNNVEDINRNVYPFSESYGVSEQPQDRLSPGRSGLIKLGIYPIVNNIDVFAITANTNNINFRQAVRQVSRSFVDDLNTNSYATIGYTPDLVDGGIFLYPASYYKYPYAPIPDLVIDDATHNDIAYDGNYYIYISIPQDFREQTITFTIQGYRYNEYEILERVELDERFATFTLNIEPAPHLNLTIEGQSSLNIASGVDYVIDVEATNVDVSTLAFAHAFNVYDYDHKYIGELQNTDDLYAGLIKLIDGQLILNIDSAAQSLSTPNGGSIVESLIGKYVQIRASVFKTVNGLVESAEAILEVKVQQYIIDNIYLSATDAINNNIETRVGVITDLMLKTVVRGNADAANRQMFEDQISGIIQFGTENTAGYYNPWYYQSSSSPTTYEPINVKNTAEQANVFDNAFQIIEKSSFLGSVSNTNHKYALSALNVTSLRPYYSIFAKIKYIYNANGYPELIDIRENKVRTYEEKQIEIHISIKENTTYDHPNPVYDVQDLLNMTAGAHYILMNDITLTNWEPFNLPAIASLDGNSYKINIDSFNFANVNDNYAGIFKTINADTVIKNLTIDITNLMTTRNVVNRVMNGEEVNANDLKIDLSGRTNVVFGILAAQNLGSITNVKIISTKADTTQQELFVYTTQDNIGTTQTSATVGGLVANNAGTISNSYIGSNYKSSQILHAASSGIYGLENLTTYPFRLVAGKQVAAFVANNSGIITNSYAKNVGIYNLEKTGDNSQTGGFVVDNSGTILSSFVEGSFTNVQGLDYRADKNTTNIYLESKGIVGGFVYTNSGEIIDAYSSVRIKSNSAQSAGFVYTNSGHIAKAYTTSAPLSNNVSADGQINTESFGAFFGKTSGLKLNNTGVVENIYYLVMAINNESKDDKEDAIAIVIDASAAANENLNPFIYEGTFNTFAFSANSSGNAVIDSIWTMTAFGPKLSFAEKDDTISFRIAQDDGSLTDLSSIVAYIRANDSSFEFSEINLTSARRTQEVIIYIDSKLVESANQDYKDNFYDSSTNKRLLGAQLEVALRDTIKAILEQSDNESQSTEVYGSLADLIERYNESHQNGQLVAYTTDNEITNLNNLVAYFRDYEQAKLYNYSYMFYELGTQRNPLLINSEDEFINFIINNSRTIAFEGKDGQEGYTLNVFGGTNDVIRYARLINNIDFTGVNLDTYLVDGLSIYDIVFAGCLEGNNLNISSLTITRPFGTDMLDDFGIFKRVGLTNDEIEQLEQTHGQSSIPTTQIINTNFTLNGVLSPNASRTGILAGSIYNTNLINLTFTGVNDGAQISGYNLSGAVAGYIGGSSKLINITVDNISVTSPYTGALPSNVVHNMTATHSGELGYVDLITNSHSYTADELNTNTTISYAGLIAGIIDLVDGGAPQRDTKILGDVIDVYEGDNTSLKVSNLVGKGQFIVEANIVGGLFGYVGFDTAIRNSEIILENSGQQLKGKIYTGGIVGQLYGWLERTNLYTQQQKLNEDTDNNIAYEYTATNIFNSASGIAVGGIAGFMQNAIITNSMQRANITAADAVISGGISGVSCGFNYIHHVYTTGYVNSSRIIGGIVGYVQGNYGTYDKLVLDYVYALNNWSLQQDIETKITNNMNPFYSQVSTSGQTTYYNYHKIMPQVGNHLPIISNNYSQFNTIFVNNKNTFNYIGSVVGMLANQYYFDNGQYFSFSLVNTDFIRNNLSFGRQNGYVEGVTSSQSQSFNSTIFTTTFDGNKPDSYTTFVDPADVSNLSRDYINRYYYEQVFGAAALTANESLTDYINYYNIKAKLKSLSASDPQFSTINLNANIDQMLSYMLAQNNERYDYGKYDNAVGMEDGNGLFYCATNMQEGNQVKNAQYVENGDESSPYITDDNGFNTKGKAVINTGKVINNRFPKILGSVKFNSLPTSKEDELNYIFGNVDSSGGFGLTLINGHLVFVVSLRSLQNNYRAYIDILESTPKLKRTITEFTNNATKVKENIKYNYEIEVGRLAGLTLGVQITVTYMDGNQSNTITGSVSIGDPIAVNFVPSNLEFVFGYDIGNYNNAENNSEIINMTLYEHTIETDNTSLKFTPKQYHNELADHIAKTDLINLIITAYDKGKIDPNTIPGLKANIELLEDALTNSNNLDAITNFQLVSTIIMLDLAKNDTSLSNIVGTNSYDGLYNKLTSEERIQFQGNEDQDGDAHKTIEQMPISHIITLYNNTLEYPIIQFVEAKKPAEVIRDYLNEHGANISDYANLQNQDDRYAAIEEDIRQYLLNTFGVSLSSLTDIRDYLNTNLFIWCKTENDIRNVLKKIGETDIDDLTTVSQFIDKLFELINTYGNQTSTMTIKVSTLQDVTAHISGYLNTVDNITSANSITNLLGLEDNSYTSIFRMWEYDDNYCSANAPTNTPKDVMAAQSQTWVANPKNGLPAYIIGLYSSYTTVSNDGELALALINSTPGASYVLTQPEYTLNVSESVYVPNTFAANLIGRNIKLENDAELIKYLQDNIYVLDVDATEGVVYNYISELIQNKGDSGIDDIINFLQQIDISAESASLKTFADVKAYLEKKGGSVNNIEDILNFFTANTNYKSYTKRFIEIYLNNNVNAGLNNTSISRAVSVINSNYKPDINADNLLYYGNLLLFARYLQANQNFMGTISEGAISNFLQKKADVSKGDQDPYYKKESTDQAYLERLMGKKNKDEQTAEQDSNNKTAIGYTYVYDINTIRESLSYKTKINIVIGAQQQKQAAIFTALFTSIANANISNIQFNFKTVTSDSAGDVLFIPNSISPLDTVNTIGLFAREIERTNLNNIDFTFDIPEIKLKNTINTVSLVAGEMRQVSMSEITLTTNPVIISTAEGAVASSNLTIGLLAGVFDTSYIQQLTINVQSAATETDQPAATSEEEDKAAIKFALASSNTETTFNIGAVFGVLSNSTLSTITITTPAIEFNKGNSSRIGTLNMGVLAGVTTTSNIEGNRKITVESVTIGNTNLSIGALNFGTITGYADGANIYNFDVIVNSGITVVNQTYKDDNNNNFKIAANTYVGGLIGYMTKTRLSALGNNVTTFEGDINVTYNDSKSLPSEVYVGGLVGLTSQKGATSNASQSNYIENTIYNSYNNQINVTATATTSSSGGTGTTTANQTHVYVGFVTGLLRGNIINVASAPNMTIQNVSNVAYHIGAIGKFDAYTSDIIQALEVYGDIKFASDTEVPSGSYVGGLAGEITKQDTNISNTLILTRFTNININSGLKNGNVNGIASFTNLSAALSKSNVYYIREFMPYMTDNYNLSYTQNSINYIDYIYRNNNYEYLTTSLKDKLELDTSSGSKLNPNQVTNTNTSTSTSTSVDVSKYNLLTIDSTQFAPATLTLNNDFTGVLIATKPTYIINKDIKLNGVMSNFAFKLGDSTPFSTIDINGKAINVAVYGTTNGTVGQLATTNNGGLYMGGASVLYSEDKVGGMSGLVNANNGVIIDSYVTSIAVNSPGNMYAISAGNAGTIINTYFAGAYNGASLAFVSKGSDGVVVSSYYDTNAVITTNSANTYLNVNGLTGISTEHFMQLHGPNAKEDDTLLSNELVNIANKNHRTTEKTMFQRLSNTQDDNQYDLHINFGYPIPNNNGIMLEIQNVSTSTGTDLYTKAYETTNKNVQTTGQAIPLYHKGMLYILRKATVANSVSLTIDNSNRDVIYNKYNYILMQDVNMSNLAALISDESLGNLYQTSFDGNNKIISNLSVKNGSGMFDIVSSATVKNIKLNTAKIEVDVKDKDVKYVGGLIGFASGEANISNITLQGATSVTSTGAAATGGMVGYIINSDLGTDSNRVGVDTGATININSNNTNNVGGLVGSFNNNTIYVTNTPITATVSGASNVGGLIGQGNNIKSIGSNNNADPDPAETITIIPNVTATSNYVGGFIGYLQTASHTSEKYVSNIAIGTESSKGSVTSTGANYVSGAFGYVEYYQLKYITNNAAINGTGYVGGVAGSIKATYITSSNLTNNGTVTAVNDLGGVFGNVNGGSYNKLTNTAAISLKNSSTAGDCGGLIGAVATTNESNKTFLTDASHSGTISIGSTATKVGGIIGEASVYQTATLLDGTISSSGTINNANATYVGGIVGYINGTATATLGGATSSMTITADQYVGGIVGGTEINTTLNNTSNSGAVTANGYLGGIVGSANENITLSSTENSGNITAKGVQQSTGTFAVCGGLVGYVKAENTLTVNGTTTNSGTITNQSKGLYTGGIVGYAGNLTLAGTINQNGNITLSQLSQDSDVTPGVFNNRDLTIADILWADNHFIKADAPSTDTMKSDLSSHQSFLPSSDSTINFATYAYQDKLTNNYRQDTVYYTGLITDSDITTLNNTATLYVGGRITGKDGTATETFYLDKYVLWLYNRIRSSEYTGDCVLHAWAYKKYNIMLNTSYQGVKFNGLYTESKAEGEDFDYSPYVKTNPDSYVLKGELYAYLYPEFESNYYTETDTSLHYGYCFHYQNDVKRSVGLDAWAYGAYSWDDDENYKADPVSKRIEDEYSYFRLKWATNNPYNTDDASRVGKEDYPVVYRTHFLEEYNHNGSRVTACQSLYVKLYRWSAWWDYMCPCKVNGVIYYNKERIPEEGGSNVKVFGSVAGSKSKHTVWTKLNEFLYRIKPYYERDRYDDTHYYVESKDPLGRQAQSTPIGGSSRESNEGRLSYQL